MCDGQDILNDLLNTCDFLSILGSSTNVSGTGSGSHTEDSRSRTSSISSLNQAQEKPLDFRPLTGIDEAKEPSRPTTRENQAVMPQHQQKQTV